MNDLSFLGKVVYFIVGLLLLPIGLTRRAVTYVIEYALTLEWERNMKRWNPPQEIELE